MGNRPSPMAREPPKPLLQRHGGSHPAAQRNIAKLVRYRHTSITFTRPEAAPRPRSTTATPRTQPRTPDSRASPLRARARPRPRGRECPPRRRWGRSHAGAGKKADTRRAPAQARPRSSTPRAPPSRAPRRPPQATNGRPPEVGEERPRGDEREGPGGREAGEAGEAVGRASPSIEAPKAVRWRGQTVPSGGNGRGHS